MQYSCAEIPTTEYGISHTQQYIVSEVTPITQVVKWLVVYLNTLPEKLVPVVKAFKVLCT